MRTTTLILLTGLLGLNVGCAFLKRFNETQPERPISTDPIVPVTTEQLVGYLNEQASHLRILRYPDVSLSIESPEGNHTLGDSTLICNQPGNFHLAGGKLIAGGKFMMIGSNEQEFWMVTERPLPETYIYCSHADFQGGAAKKLPFPIDPKWALQALGMSRYDPTMQYSVTTDNAKREHLLSYDAVTPQGDSIRNEIAFDATPSLGNFPRVKRHAIYDREGLLLAMARIDTIENVVIDYDPRLGKTISVQVPTRMHLEWPIQQTSLDLQLNEALVNRPLTPQEQKNFFTRPPTQGVNPINLAEARFGP